MLHYFSLLTINTHPIHPSPHSIDKPQSQEPIKNLQSSITINNTLKDKKENQPITNINKVTVKLKNKKENQPITDINKVTVKLSSYSSIKLSKPVSKK